MKEAIESQVEGNAAAPIATRKNEDPELLSKLFERFTRSGQGALKDRPLFGIRTLSFTLSGADCEPGVFEDENGVSFDVTLTMRALNPEQEMDAISSAPRGQVVPFHMAKCMLHRLNGALITDQKRDFVWQAIGMRGRSLCFTAYQELAGASLAALGKYQQSYSMSIE